MIFAKLLAVTVITLLIASVSPVHAGEGGGVTIRVRGKIADSASVNTSTLTISNTSAVTVTDTTRIRIRVKTAPAVPAVPAPSVNVTINNNVQSTPAPQEPKRPGFWKRLWYGSGVRATASADFRWESSPYGSYWIYGEPDYRFTQRKYRGPAVYMGNGLGGRGNHYSELSGRGPIRSGSGGFHTGLYPYEW